MLVYSDEDCPEEKLRTYYRLALVEQIRAFLLSDLHRLEVGQTKAIVDDDILKRTSRGTFMFLGRKRQKRLREFVRRNVFRFIEEKLSILAPGDDQIAHGAKDALTVTWTTDDRKKEFLGWLEDRKTVFPVERKAPGLFDPFDDETST